MRSTPSLAIKHRWELGAPLQQHTPRPLGASPLGKLGKARQDQDSSVSQTVTLQRPDTPTGVAPSPGVPHTRPQSRPDTVAPLSEALPAQAPLDSADNNSNSLEIPW